MKRIIYLLLSISAFSLKLTATELISAKIQPLNRLYIEFSDLDVNIKSSLSDDKKKITLTLDTLSANKLNDTALKSEGIIKQVKINQNLIDIDLTDARGYTIAKLPYSKNVVIEVFDWNKLTDAEEAYRMSLLALEDEITDVAKPDMLKAVQGKITDAGTFLGLILLQEGKVNSAQKNLEFAELSGTELPDTYAALAQIYTIKNDSLKAKHYEKIYKEKTSAEILPSINIKNIVEKDAKCSEPVEHLDKFLANQKKDTVKTKDTEDTTKFKNILAQDTTKTNDTTQIANNDNYKTIAKYSIAVVIAFALLLLYFYLKWRQKQLESAKKNQQQQNVVTKTETKTKNINNNAEKPKNKAEKKKKENFGQIIDKTLEEELPNNQKRDNSKKNETELPLAQESSKNNTPKVDVEQKEARKAEAPTLKVPDTPEERTQKANELLSLMQQNIQKKEIQKEKEHKQLPTIELASRLADEQKKIKEQQLSDLSETLELDENKINAISKKIGIEKSGIETKKNLSKIEDNAEEIEKLSKKFRM